MKLKPLIILLCILLIIPNVMAGNEIIDYMANVIYNDCQNKDIDVSPLGLKYIETNKSLSVLQWPYPQSMVRRVVEIIIQNEPYSVYVGGGSTKLLSCGSDELGVNFYTYKWKGERLDPFQYNNNQIIQTVDRTVSDKVNQIAVTGSGNFVDVSELKQTMNNLNQTLEANLLKINGEVNNSKVSFIDTLNVTIIMYVALTLIINFALTVALISLEYKFGIISTILIKFKNKKK